MDCVVFPLVTVSASGPTSEFELRCWPSVPRDVVFTGVATDSEQALMPALSQQPVSITIVADQPFFLLYKTGVFAAKCGTKLDHGVLSFRCGTERGTDYWKVMSVAGVHHEHKSGMTGDGANDELALTMLFALLASEWNRNAQDAIVSARKKCRMIWAVTRLLVAHFSISPLTSQNPM